MDKKDTKHLFEKYNPETQVIRCPNGKSGIRRELDLYAQTAVNLYGIISKEEFVEIFNSHHEEKTTNDEMFTLLLPIILKQKKYGFYENLLIHPWLFEDKKAITYFMQSQGNKQRFIPPKEHFLEHLDSFYLENEYWEKVLMFMYQNLNSKDHVFTAFMELQLKMTNEMDIIGGISVLEKFGLYFSNEKQLQQFVELIQNAHNNTRIWENKGFTPIELHQLSQVSPQESPQFQKRKVVGRNQPCPCGSGKKYKDCCYLIDSSNESVLSPINRQRFFHTWLKLMEYVNNLLHLVNCKIDTMNSLNNNEIYIHKIREKLWENPNLIMQYISDSKNLSQDEITLLTSWNKKHVKDRFLILEYTPNYTIMMRMDEKRTSKLYAVHGITNSISQVVQQKLPVIIETVLLPFDHVIIYDGFIGPMQMEFGKGAQDMIYSEYHEMRDEFGLITEL